ncbi:MAG: PD40 domain-containing protein [Ignavibacteriales bacterium]|nr:PD40 domain-containing protein [Ignavibacteriales bacterium]
MISVLVKRLVLVGPLLAALPHSLAGQTAEFPHTELEWKTLETEHFLVHFHTGAERTGRLSTEIAEAVYGPITTLYHHEPDQKISIILRDHDDYSNGAAYFYDNKIEVWASSMDFELRGIHPWLWNVITHELTHIIQIQTAMKLGRKIPGVYFQWFGYEAERRPDVLYGFPNVLVSYPLSAFIVPSWFAEGTAQYNHPELSFDYWDSHRDMILRMYMIDGNPLSWEEMAVFGKNSLGNESAYNAGFSIVQFIAEEYGAERLREISRELGSAHRVTIDGAIESVLGIPALEVYRRWKETRISQYRAVQERVGETRNEGILIETEGFGNFHPVFVPGGTAVAYVSNKGRDYFGQSSVYRYDVKKKKSERIVEGVRSAISFSPDGTALYYAKATHNNPHWSRFYDLYRYDIAEEEETRLTEGLRAQNPRLSSDGAKLVFAFGSDGTMNIGITKADGTGFRKITGFVNGEQVYTPVWSSDGSSIAFGYSDGHRQSLGLIDEGGGDMRLIAAEGDCRNPFFAPDGKVLYYSSDRTGIFNIWSYNLETGDSEQITNVLGGAFLPTVNAPGDLVFATYTSDGYKIALLPASSRKPIDRQLPRLIAATGKNISPPVMLGNERLNETVTAEERPYRNVFTSLSLIPFIRVDNYNPKNKGIDIVKPGLYAVSSDVLNKLSLFAGAALNRNFERDLFVILEYRDRLPWIWRKGLEPALSLELYSISRKTFSSFTLDPSPVTITPEITYNLFEFDAVARHPVLNEKMQLELRYVLSRYSADIGSFVNPNDNSLVAGFRNVYFIGNALTARLGFNGILPGVDDEINPRGRSVMLRYGYEFNKFNAEGEFEVEDGVLVPQYVNFSFQRAEISWNEYLSLPFRHHRLALGVRGGGILGKTVDSFFDFYAGGMLGMKGYPYYALGGNSMATVHLGYRFPLTRSVDFRLLQFYFTKLYASVFTDFGNAWTGTVPDINAWKKDAGFELRLESFSFYAYPTRFTFSGAYGFDRFTRQFSGVDVSYGKEWRFYFNVLFGFELGDLTRRRIR